MLYRNRYDERKSEVAESITERLAERLKAAGAARFRAIALEAGVAESFIRKFVYGGRENPRVGTIQPLVDFFDAIDRGERALPDPMSSPRRPARLEADRKTAKAAA